MICTEKLAGPFNLAHKLKRTENNVLNKDIMRETEIEVMLCKT